MEFNGLYGIVRHHSAEEDNLSLAKMIDLTIKTLDSRNHSFSVDDEFTVKQLKDQIAGSVNVPAESQRLIYCGRVLVDDKKLSEYNVHGKVIHLVQRPPPNAAGNDSGNSGSSEPRPSTNRRPLRATFFNQGGGFRGFEGPSGNSMYLGAMAFPADVMDAQGINLPSLRNMSQSRILPVRSFLRRARYTLQNLENPTHEESPAEESQQQQQPQQAEPIPQPHAPPQPPQAPAAAPTASATSSNPPIDFAFVAQALSDAMSRAAGDFSPPIINVEVLPDGANSTMASSEEQPTIQEEVVEEVPADGNSSADPADGGTPPNAPEDQANASRENGRGANGSSSGPNSRYLRPGGLADLVQQMMLIQERLNPHLQRYYELLRNDAPVENAQEAQQLFNSVGELLHHMAHAYHAISDVMCDFSQPPPRALQCRPVLIHHSAVLQTGIPIQVNLGGGSQSRGTDTGTASGGTAENLSSNNNSNDETASEQNPEARPDTGRPIGSPRVSRERGRSSRWDRGPSESSDRSADEARREQSDRNDRTPPRERRFGRAFNLPGGSLEFIMDLGHGSVQIDSVEATVIPGTANAPPASSTPEENASQPGGGGSGGGSGGGLGELFNLWEAVNLLTNWASRAPTEAASATGENQPGSGQPSPPGNTANASPNNTGAGSSPGSNAQTANRLPPIVAAAMAAMTTADRASDAAAAAATAASGAANAAASAAGADPGMQVWTSTGTQPTTSTQTRPSSRPHVHFAPNLSGIGMPSFFDPFLPCSSHHIPNSWRRSQGQQEQQGSAQPQGASNGSAGIPGGLPRGLRLAPDVTVVLQSPSHITMEIPMAGASSLRTRLIDVIDMPAGYAEGTSLYTDMFLALARQLTLADFLDLNYRRVFLRARRHLVAFLRNRVTQGRDDMQGINRGVARFIADIRPLLDASMGEFRDEPMREDVDLRASINLVNEYFLPKMVHSILSVEDDVMCFVDFRKLWLEFFRTLLSIFNFCCLNKSHASQILVGICVRFLTAVPGMHLRLRYQVQSQVEQMLSTMSPNISSVHDFVVYRMGEAPGSAAPSAAASADLPEPSVATAAITPQPSQPPPPVMDVAPRSSTPQPMEVEDGVVVAEQLAEELPDVIIDVHPEWVPIISRDRERQRRQAVQGPLSDAYLSGMPSKRRKIVSSAKPQGSLARVISESMSTAITAANVPVVGNVLESVASDSTVRRAYRDQIRQTVGSTIRSHPDFKADKYPNSAKLFDPK
ncbi:Domain of unknown function (DUF3538) [Nesidiocoris tenuis]|uniref:BCL2-associated athanogene 6 n=1 Tax=Nesidiocoris tenuis TaxID=355587 RepID=A0ABN7B7J3_9HEMI|nr:Domain of unknown function (DUF3538) [Nesidiocoris tenuis]